MNDRFKTALAFVLKHEGGLVDDPEDSGGITNHGISLRFLKSVNSRATAADIRNMARETAKRLYHRHFWETSHCDELPPGLDLAVFDCAVNQGPRTARRLLQRSLGVKDDGQIGPITRTAMINANSSEVLDDFLARRSKRYAFHPQVDRYGRGWFRRLYEIHRVALSTINTRDQAR